MIVLVTGSRDFADYPTLSRTLDTLADIYGVTEIWNGAAPGADALASRWAYERKVNVRAFGARWGDLGSKAGPVRNLEMLDAGPEYVVGFPLSSSKGTWNCLHEARRRGIPTWVVEVVE